jgi:hypothetical protein
MKCRRLRFLSLVVSFIAAASPCFAQGGATGAISGDVTDASGAALPAAQITLTGTGVQRTIVSDATGAFTIPLLPPATTRWSSMRLGLLRFHPISMCVLRRSHDSRSR